MFAQAAEMWERTGMMEMHNAQRAHPDEHVGIGEGFCRYFEGEKLMRRIIEGEEGEERE